MTLSPPRSVNTTHRPRLGQKGIIHPPPRRRPSDNTLDFAKPVFHLPHRARLLHVEGILAIATEIPSITHPEPILKRRIVANTEQRLRVDLDIDLAAHPHSSQLSLAQTLSKLRKPSSSSVEIEVDSDELHGGIGAEKTAAKSVLVFWEHLQSAFGSTEEAGGWDDDGIVIGAKCVVMLGDIVEDDVFELLWQSQP